MASVVVVHGMFNFLRGLTPPEAAARRAESWRGRLAESLAAVSPGTPVPALQVAYYADLLRRELPEGAQAAHLPADFETWTSRRRPRSRSGSPRRGSPCPRTP